MLKLNKIILPEKWVNGILLFWGIWFVCMLAFTKYATSMSIIGFGVLAFYQVVTHYQSPIWLHIKKWLGVNRISVGFFALTIIFWIVVFGFFNSENIQYWLSRVRIRLPFLALPIAFYWIPWNEKSRRIIVLLAIFLMFCSSTFVAIRYLLNFDAMNELLKRGSPIPVPMKDHIRYAQLQSFTLLSGIYWVFKDKNLSVFLKYFVWFCLGMIFFYIHLFAVRSGLLIMYTGLVVFTVLHLKKMSKAQLLMIIGLFFGTAFLAVKFIPSLEHKLGYMMWEYKEYKAGNPLNNSDSGRRISYEVGLKLYKEEPIFGVGPGDLDDKVKAIYSRDYPSVEQPKQPHNQFLHTLVCSGWVGLTIFCLMWMVLLIFAKRNQNTILITLIFATFASFLVESPLETARGTALIGFWLSFWLGEGISTERQFRPG